MENSQSAAAKCKVFHIEDDPFLANAIGQFLSLKSDLSYQGFSTSGRDGVLFCREQHPTVVILDLWLPDGDGLDRLAELSALPRPPKILVLTSRADDVTLHRAWFGPVSALVWKTHQCNENLESAFQSIARGQKFFPKDVLLAINQFRRAPEAFHKILSLREQNLMPAFGRGDSDQQISKVLELSPDTVHAHRNRIMRKLDLHKRSELMTWAMAKGFASPIRPALPGLNHRSLYPVA